MVKRGSVYCIANDTMPGLVKIGATLRNPEDRLTEARASTWACSCFRIIAQATVEDAFGTESALHALLAHRRFEARREFFMLTHTEARAVFEAVGLIAERTQGVSESSAETVERGSCNSGQWRRLADSLDSKDKLRSWVESKYTHLSLREKDAGAKLEKLHREYVQAGVHTKPLGKTTFAVMLRGVYPGIGPHKNTTASAHVYLLR